MPLSRTYFRREHADAHHYLGRILIEQDGPASETPTEPKAGARLLAQAVAQPEHFACFKATAFKLLRSYTHERDVVRTCCTCCGKTKQLKVCSRCPAAKFCGLDCAARMWPVHRVGCARLAADAAADAETAVVDDSDEASARAASADSQELVHRRGDTYELKRACADGCAP